MPIQVRPPLTGPPAFITPPGGFILIISRFISLPLRVGSVCGLMMERVGFGTRLVLLLTALPAPVQS